MRSNSFSWLWLLAPFAPSACLEHRNELGSLDVGGSVVNVGGYGGTAPVPRGGANSTLEGVCRGNAETLQFVRDCAGDADCCAVQDSSVVALTGAASSNCTWGVLAMRCDEQARYDTFVAGCPKAVGGCSPNQFRITTEDGQSASFGTEASARCEAGVCRSFLL